MELTEVSIEQMNELIARFMGYKKREKIYPTDRQILEGENLPNWYEDSLEYHTSWDWLMPVVDKIDSLTLEGALCCQSYHTSHTFYVHYNIGSDSTGKTFSRNGNYQKYCDGRHRAEGENRIKNVFLSVYKFIQWYNQQINKPDYRYY